MKILQRLKESLAPQILDRGRIILLITNVILGILISIFLALAGNTQFVEKKLNPIIDKLIKNESNEIVNKYIECNTGKIEACKELEDKMTDNIIFFDIDNKTYLEWKEPVLTPRHNLAYLIKIAAENTAKVITLDILLYDKAFNPEEDKKLVETLKGLRNTDIKIIFPCTISQNKEIKRSKIDDFDDLIDKNPNFYRGLPLIMASEDGVVRYFSGYQIVKDNNGEHKVLWGVPVLAAALYTNNFNELKDKEKKILDGIIKDNELTINLSEEKKIYITSEDIYTNRLRYFMRPPDPYDEDKQGNLSLAKRRTADLLLANADTMNEEYMEGKIVIIGNSSLSKGDTYLTPVGYMKGMYIIGNSINTIMHIDLQIIPSQGLIYLFIEAFIIIFVSFVFSFKKGFNEGFFPLIPIFVLIIPFLEDFILDKITVYLFSKKGVFLKVLLVISVMSIFNIWIYKIMKVFDIIFKTFNKLLGRK